VEAAEAMPRGDFKHDKPAKKIEKMKGGMKKVGHQNMSAVVSPVFTEGGKVAVPRRKEE